MSLRLLQNCFLFFYSKNDAPKTISISIYSHLFAIIMDTFQEIIQLTLPKSWVKQHFIRKWFLYWLMAKLIQLLDKSNNRQWLQLLLVKARVELWNTDRLKDKLFNLQGCMVILKKDNFPIIPVCKRKASKAN